MVRRRCRDRPVSQQELAPGSLDIVSFPLGSMLHKKSPDDRSGPTHGISFKVLPPPPLSALSAHVRWQLVRCQM